MNKGKKGLVVAVGFLLLPFMATTAGLAAPGKSHKGGNGKGNVKTQLEAELTQASTLPVGITVEGEAEYNRKQNKNVDRQRFTARVEIPVTPSSGTPLGLIPEADAPNALVQIQFFRTTTPPSTTPYATCDLAFDEVELDKAYYILDSRFHDQPGGHPKNRALPDSSCLIHVAEPLNPDSDIPLVLPGDSVKFVLNTTTELFTGSFVED